MATGKSSLRQHGTLLATLVLFAAASMTPLAMGDSGGESDFPPPGGISRKKPKPRSMSENSKMPALQFKMKDIDGKEQDLRQYYGHVILMVNVASECGLTPQYKGLQELYSKYKDKGFLVLGFPANEFGGQEPGSDTEIKAFCSKNYNVTFPMFSKVVVKGEDICPLFAYLTSKDADHKHGGEIKWNFNKFLIDRNGKVIGRFEPRVAPDAEKLMQEVEEALEKPIPDDSPLAEKIKKEKRSKPEKKE